MFPTRNSLSATFYHSPRLFQPSPLTSSYLSLLQLHANSESAVDDWVARLLALVSSDMPDKSWVGICLHVKNAAQIVSLSHTLVGLTVYYHILRLSRFSNTKKDAVSHASKLILPG
ncbi:unnamed protein product [Arabidopsis lyrata]|nr:unnamed protein product [Arabidopsis lyrata]